MSQKKANTQTCHNDAATSCIFSAGVQTTKRNTLTAFAVGFMAVSPISAPAYAIADNDTIVEENTYLATFFDQYTPQNAMDMILRLPGFRFEQGSNARGFGGTAGNVLVDGARPVSKSGGLQSALRRIPAAQVDRIEIIRGGISASEAAGHAIVANIIRKKTTARGTWELFLRRAPDGSVRPAGKVSLTSNLSGWDTNLTVRSGISPSVRYAVIAERDANEQLLRTDDEIFSNQNKWFIVSGEGARSVAGGKLTLNSRFETSAYNADTTRLGFEERFPDDSAHNNQLNLDEKDKGYDAEVGIDWAKTYGNGWKWHATGLAIASDYTYESNSLFSDFDANSQSEDIFIQATDQTEFILRSTYGKTGGTKLKPEFGVEVANNKVGTDTSFTVGGDTVSLDAASVTVEELRGEAFASLIYQASPKLTLNTGLTGEISRIKVTGDATASQTLKFIKPTLTATYRFSPSLQLAIEAERIVGQLSFNDFSASSEVQDNRQNAGNPNLRPQTKRVLSATIDWKFSKRGTVNVKVFHEWRRDELEHIILPSGSQGTGNAGNARAWGFDAKATLPLDRLLKGGLLEALYIYRRSSFKDPIIDGNIRALNWYAPKFLKIDFRHDIPKAKVSWGLSYQSSFTDTGFLVNEIQTFEGNNRYEAFIETTRFFGMKMIFRVLNFNTGKFTRSRFIFEEDRGSAFNSSIISNRRRKPYYRIELSSTF